MSNMNKSDVVAEMAKQSGLTKTDAEKALNAFLSTISSNLKKTGNKISLTGAFTFENVRKEARQGRNPQTGAAIQIAAKNAIKVKVGKTLQDSVN